MRIRVATPAQRLRAAERKAEAERAAGIPDRTNADARRLCSIDLRGAGGPQLNLEPRAGYHAWRARDVATGNVVNCAALKTLLHAIADQLPPTLGPRRAT